MVTKWSETIACKCGIARTATLNVGLQLSTVEKLAVLELIRNEMDIAVQDADHQAQLFLNTLRKKVENAS